MDLTSVVLCCSCAVLDQCLIFSRIVLIRHIRSQSLLATFGFAFSCFGRFCLTFPRVPNSYSLGSCCSSWMSPKCVGCVGSSAALRSVQSETLSLYFKGRLSINHAAGGTELWVPDAPLELQSSQALHERQVVRELDLLTNLKFRAIKF